MRNAVMAMVALAVVSVMAGCAIFGSGESQGAGSPIQVMDYYLVPAGQPVGLVAPLSPSNTTVVAEVNVNVTDLKGIPEYVPGAVGEVRAHIVFGAQKSTRVMRVMTTAANACAGKSPITIGDFWTVQPGKLVNLRSGLKPSFVLQLKLELKDIKGLPETVSSGIPDMRPYLVLGAEKR